MRKQGTVIRWDDARGFGFIRSPASTADVFFHIRDFRGDAGHSLRQGQAVAFEEIHVGGKGPRAMAVQPMGAQPSLQRDRNAAAPARRSFRRQTNDTAVGSGWWLALPVMLAYGAALVWAVWTKRFPLWVLAASFFVNLLAFFAYLQDKYAAQTRQWRIKEDTLHIWSLLGGWAGAWFAQKLLRHKSRKGSFLGVYWFTVLLHCAAVAALLWTEQGRFIVQSLSLLRF